MKVLSKHNHLLKVPYSTTFPTFNRDKVIYSSQAIRKGPNLFFLGSFENVNITTMFLPSITVGIFVPSDIMTCVKVANIL